MKQKVALITGASRGIGKEIAEYLAKRKYRVILMARSQEQLANVCEYINRAGGQAVYYEVDVTQTAQVKSCIEKIIAAYGQIDILFNNAGVSFLGTTDLPDEHIENMLSVNLSGAISVAKYVALQMKRQKSGYIINVSSICGKISSSFLGAYNASKFGLSGFSEALSKEMAAYGVKVTAICPSLVATDMTAGMSFEQAWMIQPSDISQTVHYLLDLSPNALPVEIVIHCLPFVAKMARAEEKIFD